LVDARPLHLHDDFLAACQNAPIGLTDGRGRERLPFELEKQPAERIPELSFDDRRGLLEGKRRHAVLKLFQFL